MKNSLLFRLVILVAAMMCALGASAQEAYAWYSPGANSLTFCYDNERSICVGTTYDLNELSARRRPTTGSTKCITLNPSTG